MTYFNFDDPLEGYLPVCVYDIQTKCMYYTSGPPHLQDGFDDLLGLYTYDMHYGEYNISTMTEVLPDIFVDWNGIPPIVPHYGGVPPAPAHHIDPLAGNWYSMEELVRSGNKGPAKAGNSSQAPNRAGSYLGPPRAASHQQSGRAGSFLGPPNAQRAPSYQKRAASYLVQPAQRATSRLGIPSQSGFANSGPRTSSFRGPQPAPSTREPARRGLSFPANPSRANTFLGSNVRLPNQQPEISSYRQFIHALHDHHRPKLIPEKGHHFDHVDDSILASYTHALGHDAQSPRITRLTLKPKHLDLQNPGTSWSFPIAFLGLQHNTLEVFFPLDHETISNLSNDVLRVLHIRLTAAQDNLALESNNGKNPADASDADMAQTRRVVAAELRRRGFPEREHAVHFQGLPRPDSTPADAVTDTAPVRPSASVFQPAQARQKAEATRVTVREQWIDEADDTITTHYGPARAVRRAGAQKGKEKGRARVAEVSGESSGEEIASPSQAKPSISFSGPEEDLYSASDRGTSENENGNGNGLTPEESGAGGPAVEKGGA